MFQVERKKSIYTARKQLQKDSRDNFTFVFLYILQCCLAGMMVEKNEKGNEYHYYYFVVVVVVSCLMAFRIINDNDKRCEYFYVIVYFLLFQNY